MESNVEHSLSVNVLGLGICPVVCVFASGDVESGPKWRKGSSTELGTMAGQGLEHLPSVGYMLLHLGPFSFGLGQPAPSCRNRFQLRAGLCILHFRSTLETCSSEAGRRPKKTTDGCFWALFVFVFAVPAGTRQFAGT